MLKITGQILALAAVGFAVATPRPSQAAPADDHPSAAPDFSDLEPHTRAFIEGLAAKGGPPMYALPPAAARSVFSSLQDVPVSKMAADVEDRTIPGGTSGSISLRIVRPSGEQESSDARGRLPVIMYFHGGGFVLGDADTHDRLIREIANGVHAVVVFVNYRRAPEVQYPVPVEECYAATEWVAAHGADLHLDGSRLAVAGDSAGGNMAAVIPLLAKERRGPKIALQVLFYPMTDAAANTPSRRKFAGGPWLSKAEMDWYQNAYAPDPATWSQPMLSPLQASLDQVRGLPPALVITAEYDALRDEGEAYARKLSQAGVSVTATRYLGTIHDVVILNALANTPAARAAIAQANAALREALARPAHQVSGRGGAGVKPIP